MTLCPCSPTHIWLGLSIAPFSLTLPCELRHCSLHALPTEIHNDHNDETPCPRRNKSLPAALPFVHLSLSPAMAILANLVPFFLFSAFVLLLLVTLSAPIIDPIYLFRLSADVGGSSNGGSGSIQFGVFGYCVSAIETS